MDGYDPYAAQQYAYGAPLPHLAPIQPHQPVASTSQLPPPPPAGDWTAQLAMDGMQLPPGGSILLPPAQTGFSALPEELSGGTQLVKVTAKSCANCRTRKVKCDRRYPECTRCVKRKELCDYGDDVSIALRPTWVLPSDEDALTSPPVVLSSQVPLTGPAPTARQPYTPAFLPYPPRPHAPYDPHPSVRVLSDMQHHQALVRQRGLHQVGAAGGTREREEREDEEAGGERGFADLWENFLVASNLGQSSSDWRLAQPSMASSLQIHLLDASMHSCCFHLPAFHIFNRDIRYFKENIDQLDIASQVIVGILTSLGARASPHSALLGIAGPDIENGKASLDLVRTAGVRRENAWRAIVKRATDLCSKMEILQVPTARNLQTLVAFVQMLMLAEVQPKTARFFLRTAMGLFRDMQHANLPSEEVQAIKLSVGPTLYESDARIAAYLSMPVCISEEDVYEYFDGTGVHVPDLDSEDLGPLLDDILDPARGPATREKLDRALGLTGSFVCAVQRAFSNLSSSRRPNTRFLTTIPQLWTYVDRAHAAVQRLHRRLVQLDYTPAGCDAHHSVDYDLLIGVRMDERLLDIVHLAHVWLVRQRRMDLTVNDRTALEDLLGTSERRVRKCLKLLAFYSKVFVDSVDKHCVYHLFTQLEALPGWATMVAQREGEPTDFGPLPAECVLTDVELDWFTHALELACFFTPLGNERLRDLNAARAARSMDRAPPYMAFGDYDLSVPPTPGMQASYQQHQPGPFPQYTASNGGLAPRQNNPQHATPPNFPPTAADGARPSSPSWTFDNYGTPLAFDDISTPTSVVIPRGPGFDDGSIGSQPGGAHFNGHAAPPAPPPSSGSGSVSSPSSSSVVAPQQQHAPETSAALHAGEFLTTAPLPHLLPQHLLPPASSPSHSQSASPPAAVLPHTAPGQANGPAQGWHGGPPARRPSTLVTERVGDAASGGAYPPAPLPHLQQATMNGPGAPHAGTWNGYGGGSEW